MDKSNHSVSQDSGLVYDSAPLESPPADHRQNDAVPVKPFSQVSASVFVYRNTEQDSLTTDDSGSSPNLDHSQSSVNDPSTDLDHNHNGQSLVNNPSTNLDHSHNGQSLPNDSGINLDYSLHNYGVTQNPSEDSLQDHPITFSTYPKEEQNSTGISAGTQLTGGTPLNTSNQDLKAKLAEHKATIQKLKQELKTTIKEKEKLQMELAGANLQKKSLIKSKNDEIQRIGNQMEEYKSRLSSVEKDNQIRSEIGKLSEQLRKIEHHPDLAEILNKLCTLNEQYEQFTNAQEDRWTKLNEQYEQFTKAQEDRWTKLNEQYEQFNNKRVEMAEKEAREERHKQELVKADLNTCQVRLEFTEKLRTKAEKDVFRLKEDKKRLEKDKKRLEEKLVEDKKRSEEDKKRLEEELVEDKKRLEEEKRTIEDRLKNRDEEFKLFTRYLKNFEFS